MPSIKTAESHLAIGYAIEPGDSTRYVFVVMLLDDEMGRDIVRGASSNYALVVILAPVQGVYPFLRGSFQHWTYVRDKLGLSDWEAKLTARLLPALTEMLPPDEVLAVGIQAVKDLGEEAH